MEVEVEDSAVEVEIELEAAQSRSVRIRALDGVDVPAMFCEAVWSCRTCQDFCGEHFRNAVRVALDEIKRGMFWER